MNNYDSYAYAIFTTLIVLLPPPSKAQEARPKGFRYTEEGVRVELYKGLAWSKPHQFSRISEGNVTMHI